MVVWDIFKADTYLQDILSKVYMLYFSLGCKTEVVSQAVIVCRESRLSCIYLPNSVTL